MEDPVVTRIPATDLTSEFGVSNEANIKADFPFPKPYDTKEMQERFRIENIPVGLLEEGKGGSYLFISKFPDIDGNQIYIPRIVPAEDGIIDDQFSRELAEQFPDRVTSSELKPEDKERLLYALDILGLPIALAVHLTMNRNDLDISEFVIPTGESRSSSMVSFYGSSGIGKTELVTLLSFYHSAKIVEFDPFSEGNVQLNLDRIRESGMTPENSVEEVDSVFHIDRALHLPGNEGYRKELKKKKPKDGSLKSATMILDEVLDEFKDGVRPPLVICDMPGHPSWMLHNVERYNDIFDSLAFQGFESMYYIKGNMYLFSMRISLDELEFYVENYPFYEENTVAGGEYIKQKAVDLLKTNDLNEAVWAGVVASIINKKNEEAKTA